MAIVNQIRISPLTRAMFPEAANLLLASHTQDPLQRHAHPFCTRDFSIPWSRRIKDVIRDLEMTFKDTETVLLAALYLTENRLVGILRTSISSRSHLPDQVATTDLLGMHAWAFETREVDPEFAKKFYAAYRKALAGAHLPKVFWYMEGLTTLPGFERQGIAGKLIEAMFLKLASFREAPSRVFALCNDKAARLYGRYGFEVSSKMEVILNEGQPAYARNGPPVKWTETCMTYDLAKVMSKPGSERAMLLRRLSAQMPKDMPVDVFSRAVRPVVSLSDLSKSGSVREPFRKRNAIDKNRGAPPRPKSSRSPSKVSAIVKQMM